VPLYRFFGLNPTRAPQTSFTIGLGRVEVVQTESPELAIWRFFHRP
jgi:hypothetical protein